MTHQLQLDTMSIAYVDSDPHSKTKPVLFFIHGNSASKRSFEKQFQGSLKDQYRLVAFDLPGHGESRWNEGVDRVYSLDFFSKLICEVTVKLGCSSGVFIGHSLGGHLLLQAKHCLSQAKGLVILGTPPLTNPPNFEEGFLPAQSSPCFFKAQLSNQEIQVWAEDCFLSTDLIPEYFCQSIRSADPAMREGFAVSIASLQYEDEKKILKELPIPVSIFHGEKERLVNLNYLQSLECHQLWRKSVQVLKGTSHNPHLEDAEQFDQLLGEFAAEAFRS